MRRFISTGLRLALLVIAGFFLVRIARAYARDLSDVRFEIDALGIAAASALWLASYAFLVRLWAGSMKWWGTQVGLVPALRVFAAANLARYIPGGVWQFASLAAMSASSGLSVVSVASAAVFQQVVLAGTGLLIGLAIAPASALGASWSVPIPVLVGLVAAGVAGLVLVLPPVTRWLDTLLSRRRKVAITLPRVHRGDVAVYVILTAAGWIGYAIAFVIFTHAVLDPVPVHPVILGASFVLSYVVGILAVFAPSGLIVREAAIVALLAPVLGEQALALAIASRLWLTLIDAALSSVLLLGSAHSADPRVP